MLPNAHVQSQQCSSVQVEHFINTESTPDVVVQDTPIAENLFIDKIRLVFHLLLPLCSLHNILLQLIGLEDKLIHPRG